MCGAGLRRLSILAPTRYPWRFNSPRHSRHHIATRNFIPLNKVDYRIEGVTAFNPLPLRRFDLIHAFNRIPLGAKPYLIGFESHLPRAYGMENTPYFKALQASLAGRRCRGIIAISKHAEAVFRSMHAGSPHEAALLGKLTLRYPNVEIDEGARDALAEDTDDGPMRITFVGAHFARKGGCVAIRIAELAGERGVPVEVTIISALEMGGNIWTDPARAGYFEDWRRRLDHPLITVANALPNAEVLAVLARSHFSLLTTFSDTFGYSALESMMGFCPVIATRQGALPEFIHDGINGRLLELETSPVGEWVYSNSSGRATPAFEKIFTDEIERLAEESLAAIVAAMQDRGGYRKMRSAARATVVEMFDAGAATPYWDERYEQAVAFKAD